MTTEHSYTGLVASGRGLARPGMSEAVLAAIRRLTGVDVVPGTLNVRLTEPLAHPLPLYITEDDLGVDLWSRSVAGRRGLRVAEVLIAGRYRGLAFQGDEPDYPADQLELVSEVHLRDALSLGDGDPVAFTFAG